MQLGSNLAPSSHTCNNSGGGNILVFFFYSLGAHFAKPQLCCILSRTRCEKRYNSFLHSMDWIVQRALSWLDQQEGERAVSSSGSLLPHSWRLESGGERVGLNWPADDFLGKITDVQHMTSSKSMESTEGGFKRLGFLVLLKKKKKKH